MGHDSTDTKTRLGAMLVAAGVLTPAQLEEALRAQVLWGGRLGTNLVNLEMVQLDALAKVLGRQRRVAAALEQHFEAADPKLQRMLPAPLAEQLACIPLARIAGRRIAVASLDPLDGPSLRLLGDQLGVAPEQLESAIAPELRIRYQLERVYGIARNARFLRAPGKTTPPFRGADPGLDGDTQLDVDIDVDLEDARADSGRIELPANRAEPKPSERDAGFAPRTPSPAAHGQGGREALVRKPPQPVRASLDIGELELSTRPATNPTVNPPGLAKPATTTPPAARAPTSPPVRKPPEPRGLDFDLGELELPGSTPSPPPAARTSTSPPAATRPSTTIPAGKPSERPALDFDLGELELAGSPASSSHRPAGKAPEPAVRADELGLGELELPARAAPVRTASEPDLALPASTPSAALEAARSAILVLDDPQPAAERPAAPVERRYVRTLADAVPPPPGAVAGGEQPAATTTPVPVAAKPATAKPDPAVATTIRAIRAADDRERVAELVVEALSNRAGHVAGLLLVVRGEAAIGWKGFNTLHTPLDELAVPMDRAGIVPQTIARGGTQRSPISKLGTIDRRLGEALRAADTDELAIIPVRIVGQVMCFLALAMSPGANLEAAESIAHAAGISFTRLIRNANR